MTVELAPMIVADKHTLGGKPRVKGTRQSNPNRCVIPAKAGIQTFHDLAF
jgi:uncharacterized protein (DUF433 family)